ncbi:MAG TPA: molybdenum cofactor guanylyltransferase [Candidatus Binataceae bacterium]|nr:molybdenum cofactor guanylyltransferase [Candidatus Binataceae bacterium]
MADCRRLSAVVLVGGRSSRMGRDKATLPFDGTTLIERTVATLHRAFADVLVVAAPESISEKFPTLDATIIRDEAPFAGPVPALLIGLRAARYDPVFACSCDLPMLNAALAAWLCSIITEKNDAVIPIVSERLQVLHAVYRKRCTSALDTMLASGEKSLRALAPLLDVRAVVESDMRQIDPELRSFFNLNTPDDYAAAVELVGSRK